jgi:hypothetical protein
MVEGIEPHCFGVRLEKRRFSDPTFCKKLRIKFVWLERTYELCNLGSRVTLIIGEES